VTASTDGSYFRPHTDQGKSAIDATRKLTYVYYFNREPRGFTGGDLRIYDDEFQNGKFSSNRRRSRSSSREQQHRVLQTRRSCTR
jgi:Rps23 Pro-64 3,4-dihydroxylase Tpa1-like proline 4-hydroxylase